MPRPAHRPELTVRAARGAERAMSELAEAALQALRELLGGVTGDEASAAGELRRIHRELMMLVARLVFRRHAEERGLLSADSLADLFARLSADAGRDLSAMERRRTAWPQLVALAHELSSEEPAPPLVTVRDGAVWRALRALLLTDGSPRAYHAIDIEQLGGVYEALLDQRLLRAGGPSLAVRPGHVVVDLAELLSHAPARRIHRLAETAGGALDGALQAALAAANSPEDLAAALARRRSPRTPAIIPAGCLYVQPGEERRRAGAHYTPRELTDPLVRATLRPLLAALGERPTAVQLLALRLCDPAMGSGAFLLSACRQLGEQLEQAWRRDGVVIPGGVAAGEHARRMVAGHCLHGVDKDPCAVELARLSLWLATGGGAPLRGFMAATIRCGDALVGLDRAQIAAFSWHPAASGAYEHSADEPAIARTIGDAAVAAFFGHDGDRRRDEHRERLARATVGPARRGDSAAVAALERLAATLATSEPPVVPFHWELAFPAVFARDNPGFDGFVGNPPFFWGNRISRAFGDRYRDWLLRCYPGSHGNSDLAAYFLRRAFALLRRGGALGFVTTNSIAEADTRATGLDHLLAAGGVIYEAVRSAEWGGSASVRVAHLCVARGGDPGERRLDGQVVAAIGGDLRRPRAAWTAVRLRERAGESYKGVDFGGTGFLLTPAQREAIVRDAPHEAACIWPVMNASKFVSSPQLRAEEFIINFTGLTLAEAERFERCMAIVRERVLPRRAVDKRKARRERWWLYNEGCSGLYRAIAGKSTVLACAVVAKFVSFAFVDAHAVFTNALNVFTLDGPAALGLLQSRVHELWALTHSSSLRADPRYNPSDCFETFPFPHDWRRCEALARAGQDYDECRRRCMLAGELGLTALYNRFHDPGDLAADIAELRELHDALDRAALAAYGWTDLAARATADFIATSPEPRMVPPTIRRSWSATLADEVLGRLLALNRERAGEERGAGEVV
ncbi:type IIL restriction-modification enzyme MmeI [Nannocystis sp. SCPEA4]|uniref:Eco57I restriction-modification methylase domain-containing protein n=1 Tax=Nannocystis sp. SCPEA4 TaxID=2996787 RepID=UPI00226F8FAA|nr:type IIL restriction-modification enzyme MmeI [Nannocystis sp. SCPEA4]MCY1061707.1 hypothetical protein [Nannocystis sp. SCPEA4]